MFPTRPGFSQSTRAPPGCPRILHFIPYLRITFELNFSALLVMKQRSIQLGKLLKILVHLQQSWDSSPVCSQIETSYWNPRSGKIIIAFFWDFFLSVFFNLWGSSWVHTVQQQRLKYGFCLLSLFFCSPSTYSSPCLKGTGLGLSW